MKRLIIAMLLVVFVTVTAHGAGTVTVTGPTKVHNTQYVVVFTCTADAADGSYPQTDINQDYARMLNDLEGFWLSHVKVTPDATTAPVDDSDLALTVGGTDILGGNGVDIVDNAVDGYCVPYGSSNDAQYPMTVGHNMKLVITGNTTNSAVTVVTLVFEN